MSAAMQAMPGNLSGLVASPFVLLHSLLSNGSNDTTQTLMRLCAVPVRGVTML